MWEPAWRRSGQEPDYRFSLANERTFLAWIRSALALLAGAVLLVQFGTRLAPPWLLAATAIALAVSPSATHWRTNSSPRPRDAPMIRVDVMPALWHRSPSTAIEIPGRPDNRPIMYGGAGRRGATLPTAAWVGRTGFRSQAVGQLFDVDMPRELESGRQAGWSALPVVALPDFSLDGSG